MFEVYRRLKQGLWVSDELFDSLYNPAIRTLSETHWTPIQVARVASDLFFEQSTNARILDVGSGCGKASIVMALSNPSLSITGIEQRQFLTDAANRIIDDLKVQNAYFLNENVFHHDWSNYEGFYFFNPFYEQTRASVRMRDNIPFSEELYNSYTEEAHQRLKTAKTGAMVLTYHGYGGDMPVEYHLKTELSAGTDRLSFWIKK